MQRKGKILTNIKREEQEKYAEDLQNWSGVLLVNKPMGISSRQVDSVIKRLISFKKVGHIGTLDPFATGLLHICIGKSTAVVPYLENLEKKYKVFVHLGLATDTLDSQGKPLFLENTQLLDSRSAAGQAYLQSLAKAPYTKIKEALKKLQEEKEQYPPLYSAVKVNGKPLYAYARAGKTEEIQIKSRKIEIFEASLQKVRLLSGDTSFSALDLQEQDFFESYFQDREKPSAVDAEVKAFAKQHLLLELEIDFTVSKGTYIRSLCERLGEILGVCAYAARLTRLEVGASQLAEAHTLQSLMQKDANEIRALFQQPGDVLAHIEALQLTEKEALALTQGKHLWVEKLSLSKEKQNLLLASKKIYRLFFDTTFAGLVKVENKKLIPERMFWQK